MCGGLPDRRTRYSGEVAIQHFSVGLLSALLLFFCISARLARYEIDKPTLRLASTQSYLDGEELRKELSKTKPIWSFVALVSLFLLVLIAAIPLPIVLTCSPPFERFSPQSSPRSPPVW